MTRLPKKQLKELFESTVAEDGAKCGKANPFILEKGKFKCYVFIKNISPAYYPNYPDNSRVQLPTSDRFKEVIESDLDFLILGYDKLNEVFVTWNPSLIKDRLNDYKGLIHRTAKYGSIKSFVFLTELIEDSDIIDIKNAVEVSSK